MMGRKPDLPCDIEQVVDLLGIEVIRDILTQPEGFVTGMAAKMFTVAGPVITFGTLASVIYGVILMLLK